MKFEQLIYDWKNRELPFKKQAILEAGFTIWEDFRFSKDPNNLGNLIQNQICSLINFDRDFDFVEFDLNLLKKSVFAPFSKWNLGSLNANFQSTFITTAYMNVYKYNLWSNSYQNAINRMLYNQNMTLIGVYSSSLDTVLIIDGCETIIAYLRMIANGYTPQTCNIFLQTINFELEDLFLEIYSR